MEEGEDFNIKVLSYPQFLFLIFLTFSLSVNIMDFLETILMSVGSLAITIGPHSEVLCSEIVLSTLLQSQEEFCGGGMVVSSG